MKVNIIFLIDAPTDYKKLVIEAKSMMETIGYRNSEGGIEQLEVLSFWDGLYFRSDNTTFIVPQCYKSQIIKNLLKSLEFILKSI